jgi:hypothetical protein
MSRDYDGIHHIRQEIAKYNGDDKLSDILERCFNWMCNEEEDNGCLIQTTSLYIAMCNLGYNPQICYGLCILPNKQEFYHAWLELDNRIIDIAIYGNIKWGLRCQHKTIQLPVIMSTYKDAPFTYGKFCFDNDWKYAGISIVDRMDIFSYIQNAPNQCVRKRIGYITNQSRANVEEMIKKFAHKKFR